MKISVIIPTKNEPLINKLVEDVHNVLKGTRHEIIVVDKSDIKPDIKGAKLILQKSNGLGKAILEGLKHTNGDIIVTMDGDYSHRPKDLVKLLEKAKDHDIVIGSRFVKGGVVKDRAFRKTISDIFRKFASFALFLNVEDPLSGFSAIKRHVYDRLKLNPLGYKINMEILYKAKRYNLKVIEVPITFYPRKAGKSKAGFREALNIIRFVFELRLGLR
jgi:dolichol-phosphate mannosyltransferase